MSDMESFFPTAQKLPIVGKKDLELLNFTGTRHDLEVYHLAYKTKKLKPSTIRRMMKRQQRINDKKQQKFIPRGPIDIQAKAEKRVWLENVEKIVAQEKLTTISNPLVLQRRKKISKAGLRLRRNNPRIPRIINQFKNFLIMGRNPMQMQIGFPIMGMNSIGSPMMVGSAIKYNSSRVVRKFSNQTDIKPMMPMMPILKDILPDMNDHNIFPSLL